MPHAEANATVAVDADTLWRDAGGFEAVGDWHPWLASVTADGDQPGSPRTAVTQEGGEQVERLDHVDAANRSYRYTMVSTAMPVTNYVADFRIEPAGRQSSTVRWSSEFDVTSGDEADAVGMIEGFLTAGVEALRRRYG